MTKERLTLGLCLLIALVLWIPQKLTKNYTHKISIQVGVQTPNNRLTVGNTIESFPIEISGKGNKLYKLDNRLKRDTLLLPYSGSDLVREYDATEIIAHLRDRYEIPMAISIRPDIMQLSFEFDSITTKSVAVNPIIFFELKSGFGKIGQLKLRPPTVEITGPHEILNDIDFINSDTIDLGVLDQTTEKLLDLSAPNSISKKYINPKQVVATIEIDQLAEKELTIQLNDFKKDGKLWNLFPDKVKVTLSVPLKQYHDLTASAVEIELSDLGNQAVSVSITKLPPNTDYITHSPKILRYFVQRNDTLR